MTKKILGILTVATVLILAGCKQDMDNTTLNPYLYDYVPLDIGHSVIYDVDSISYSFVNGGTQQVTTSYYQLMYQVYDTFYTSAPTTNYGIYIWKRTDTTQPFQLWQEQYCWQTRNTYEDVENDLHFLKLVFPPINGVNWQGNQYLPANDTVMDTYFPYAGWNYTYTSVNVPQTFNNVHFDSTLTVMQDSNQNLINDLVSVESYARHVGMIYKKWEIINKQSISSTWANPDSANGFRIIMTFHSYTP